MNEGKFVVDIPVYQGPMDLLLHVVRQRHIDYSELKLASVARDFLTFARNTTNLDLDSAGEIIYIAAVLIRMKVKSLLPASEDEDAPAPEDLVEEDEELEEIYRGIVAAARKLADRERESRDYFPRGSTVPDDFEEVEEELVQDVTLVQLAEAFREVSQRLSSTSRHQLSLFSITIEEQQNFIMDLLSKKSEITFVEMVEDFVEKIEAVVAFLAILDLVRRRRIKVLQRKEFGTLVLKRGAEFSSFVRHTVSSENGDIDKEDYSQYD